MHSQNDQVKIRLNWRLLLGLVVLTGLTGGGAYGARTFWRNHNAPSLLKDAQAAYAAGDLEVAGRRMALYLRLKPTDTDALIELSEWMEKQANVGELDRVYQMLSDAALQAPDQAKVHGRLFEIGVMIAPFFPEQRKRFYTEAAETHFPKMSSEARENPINLAKLAVCHEELEQFDQAAEVYLAALNDGSKDVDSYMRLAALAMRKENPLDFQLKQKIAQRFVKGEEPLPTKQKNWLPEHDKSVEMSLVDAMVRNAEPVWKAQLTKAYWMAEKGDREGALKQGLFARSAGPEEPDVWSFLTRLQRELSQIARAQGNGPKLEQSHQSAQQFAIFGARVAPGDPQFPFLLGLLALDVQEPKNAEKMFREAIVLAKKRSDDASVEQKLRFAARGLLPQLDVILASTLVTRLASAPEEEQKALEQEIDGLIRVLDKRQAREQSDLLAASKLQAEKRWKEAATAWETLGNNAKTDFNWKMAIQSQIECQKQLQDWAALKAVSLAAKNRDSTWAFAWQNLGEANQRLGNKDDADEAFARAKELDKDWQSELIREVAAVRALPEEQRNWAPITKKLETAAEEDKTNDFRLTQLRVAVLEELGEFVDAEKLLVEAQSKFPKSQLILFNLVGLEFRRTDLEVKDRFPRAALAIDRFRVAYGNQVRLVDAAVGEEGPLWKSIPVEPANRASALHAMLLELRGDLAAAQAALVKGLEAGSGDNFPAQKYVEFCLRHERRLPDLTDRSLGILASVLSQMPGRSGLPRLVPVLEHWSARGEFPLARRLDLARAYGFTGKSAEAWTLFGELADSQSQNAAIVTELLFFGLSQPGELDATQKKSLSENTERLARLRPLALETILCKARLAAKLGTAADGVPPLVEFAATLDRSEPAELFRSLARLGRGEGLLRRFAVETQNDPETQKSLADSLRKLVADDSQRLDPKLYASVFQNEERQTQIRRESVRSVIATLEALKEFGPAKKMLKSTLDSQDDPVLGMDLAILHARGGDYDAALALVSKYEVQDPEAAAAAYGVILELAAQDASVKSKVLEGLTSFVGKEIEEKRLVPALMLLADHKLQPAKLNEAIALYDRALPHVPKSPITLNNLAYAEAFSEGRRQQALVHIDRAIEVDAARAEFLDTRALALLQLGRNDEAEKILDQVIQIVPSKLFLFHLAVASQRSKHPEKATAALAKAKELGFTREGLPELERPLLDEIEPSQAAAA
ncbi:MAG: hypothetical protein NT069_32405, partial [Planctomycetota bacterium]|nr:hypothetical protein [Planctomycetota bacterium]